MSMLRHAWQTLWADLGLSSPDWDLWVQLMAAYREPHRHYHTLQHLQDCLHTFESVTHLAEHPGEVALALWFHDAIYDVRGQDNEQQSAAWADRVLQAAGIDGAIAHRVHHLILATQHTTLPIAPDEQLIVDVDLAILGASPERFAQYQTQIRAEYAWVPEEVYQTKRRAILQSFLERPEIYHTPYFRDRLEALARENLNRAIAELQSPPL